MHAENGSVGTDLGFCIKRIWHTYYSGMPAARSEATSAANWPTSLRNCVLIYDVTVKVGRAALSSIAVSRASSVRPACS